MAFKVQGGRLVQRSGPLPLLNAKLHEVGDALDHINLSAFTSDSAGRRLSARVAQFRYTAKAMLVALQKGDVPSFDAINADGRKLVLDLEQENLHTNAERVNKALQLLVKLILDLRAGRIA